VLPPGNVVVLTGRVVVPTGRVVVLPGETGPEPTSTCTTHQDTGKRRGLPAPPGSVVTGDEALVVAGTMVLAGIKVPAGTKVAAGTVPGAPVAGSVDAGSVEAGTVDAPGRVEAGIVEPGTVDASGRVVPVAAPGGVGERTPTGTGPLQAGGAPEQLKMAFIGTTVTATLRST